MTLRQHPLAPRVQAFLRVGLSLVVLTGFEPSLPAQQTILLPVPAAAVSHTETDLPEAPQATPSSTAPTLAPAALSGTVTDANAGLVPAAAITLDNTTTGEKRSTSSDNKGFFTFPAIPPGTFTLTIHAEGFATWLQSGIPIRPGEDLYLPTIALVITATTSSIQVSSTQYELAEAQLKAEEKQRVFAVFPNFYSSYDWHAAPLSAGQKFRLAWKSGTDPVAFLAAGVAAGVEQARDSFSGYGQGAQGYGKRYGAAYADSLIGSLLSNGALPALFHQDPRFFYKADGTTRQRLLYALSTAVIRRGDNGRWQPDYSGILGNFGSGALSNIYYPSSNRGAGLTIGNASLGIAFGAVGAVLREFVVPKLTSGGPPKTTP